MTLSEKQKEEAHELYRLSKLNNSEREYMKKMDELRGRLSEAQRAFNNGQRFCPHPLIMRDFKNEGNTGNWDRNDSYWTNHHCTLCGLRWTTAQNWEQVGSKLGHPNDEKAKEDM